jgi:hypothetical protein
LVFVVIVQSAFATPIIGVDTTPLAIGTFDGGLEAHSQTDALDVDLRSSGPTDVYMLENKIAPGGTYGRHSHPGPSIVVVQSDEVTLYRAADAACTPQVFGAGTGFVDQGGDVHVVRKRPQAPGQQSYVWLPVDPPRAYGAAPTDAGRRFPT